MENNIGVPLAGNEVSRQSNEEADFQISISTIKKEPIQIKTEDVTDEEFLECIGLTSQSIEEEPGYEEEYLESDCSESNLVINEQVFTEIKNEIKDDSSALADFIEANKLVVDYDAHITKEPDLQMIDTDETCNLKKRKALDVDASHRYKCGVCFVRFHEKRRIKQHMTTHSDVDVPVDCYCNCNSFSLPMSVHTLQTHRHTQQNKIIKCFKCIECGTSFDKKASFEEHNSLRSHRCPVCTTLTFASCIDIKHHQVIHHGDQFSCTKCGRLFRFIEHYRNHCTECEYSACDLCDKLFKTNDILRKHIEMLHLSVDDLFQCHLCEKIVNKLKYVDHNCYEGSISHTTRVKVSSPTQNQTEVSLGPVWSGLPKLPLVSDRVTPATAVSLGNKTKVPRKRYGRKRKGEYSCEYCNRTYPWISSLRRHVSDTHINTKSYWCGKCLKVFRLKCTLEIHKCNLNKRREKGLPLSCPACPQHYQSLAALSIHIMQIHPDIVNMGETLEDSQNESDEEPIEEDQPDETTNNTEMRAAELFHMFTEDFEDDLILLNSNNRIEIDQVESKSPEPEIYESIDDYLQSTDRINQIKLSMEETLESSEPFQIKEEPIEILESSDEEFLEQLQESLEIVPQDVKKTIEDSIEKDAIYSCFLCKYTVCSFENYLDHWIDHGYNTEQCPQCKKKIVGRAEFVSHIDSHVRCLYRKARMYKVKSIKDLSRRTNNYSCKKCGVYVLKGRRYRHWEAHIFKKSIGTNKSSVKNEKNYDAELNFKTESRRKEVLSSNVKNYKYIRNSNCEEGKKIYQHRATMLKNFQKIKLLEKLAATESSMDPEDQDIVEMVTEEPLDKESLCASTSNLMEKICAICHKKFGRIQCLKRHLIEHIVTSIMHKKDPKREFMCRLCVISFPKVHTFKRHLRQHADLPIYDCNLCYKSFADSSNYAKHKKVHGCSAYMQCDLCGRKFNTKRMLIGHMQYHEKNKPQPCPFCEKMFYFASGLNKHIKLVHHKHLNKSQQKCYPCKYCTLRFGSLKEMWIHQWTEHGVRNRNFDCPICKHGYRTFTELHRHLRNSHSVAIKTFELKKMIEGGYKRHPY